jgi:hypothetical protein
MRIKKSYNLNQLRDYSTIFSRGEVIRWIKSDLTSLDLKIKRYDSKFSAGNRTYLSYLKYIYKILETFYANEYVYKNELINKWLMDEVGSSDSVVFNEFRSGKAVADLAMFNGISKAFEIKTTLDKDTRLNSQVCEYQKLFNEVYLIVPESKVENYLKLYPDVGIVVYQELGKEFRLAKSASNNRCIDVNALMGTLHTHEYISIVEQYYGSKPSFTDFNKFEVCKELIEEIPQKYLNDLFLTAMKRRKIFNDFSKSEKQLNQLFLSLNLSHEKQHKLLDNLRSCINT